MQLDCWYTTELAAGMNSCLSLLSVTGAHGHMGLNMILVTEELKLQFYLTAIHLNWNNHSLLPLSWAILNSKSAQSATGEHVCSQSSLAGWHSRKLCHLGRCPVAAFLRYSCVCVWSRRAFVKSSFKMFFSVELPGPCLNSWYAIQKVQKLCSKKCFSPATLIHSAGTHWHWFP